MVPKMTAHLLYFEQIAECNMALKLPLISVAECL